MLIPNLLYTVRKDHYIPLIAPKMFKLRAKVWIKLEVGERMVLVGEKAFTKGLSSVWLTDFKRREARKRLKRKAEDRSWPSKLQQFEHYPKEPIGSHWRISGKESYDEI